MLHAHLFDLPADAAKKRVEEVLADFSLESVADTLTESLPLGYPATPVSGGLQSSMSRRCSFSMSPRRVSILLHGRILGNSDPALARKGASPSFFPHTS